MKFVIIWKKKSYVKLIKSCDSKDLVTMGTSMIEEAIRSLVEEKSISRESAIKIIQELLNEKIFINQESN